MMMTNKGNTTVHRGTTTWPAGIFIPWLPKAAVVPPAPPGEEVVIAVAPPGEEVDKAGDDLNVFKDVGFSVVLFVIFVVITFHVVDGVSFGVVGGTVASVWVVGNSVVLLGIDIVVLGMTFSRTKICYIYQYNFEIHTRVK